jgi:type I restriction enzyme S subunit
LDEVANVVAGNPAPQGPGDFVEGGHLFIRMQDVGREHRTANIRVSTDRVSAETVAKYRLRLFPPGSVLIPKSGASVNLNHRAMLGCDAYVVSHLAVVVPNREMLLSEYLYYWSLSYDPRNQAQTTSLPSLPLSLIKAASIPVPPLPEQCRIVDLLSRAEGIVRLRREAEKKAAELIPALFIDTFGDPATNPKGWATHRLGDLALKMSDGPFGSNLKTSHYTATGIRVIRLQNIGIGALNDKDQAFVSLEHFASLPRHCCIPGDVLIATLGDPNLRAMVLPSSIPKALNKADCVQFRCNPECVTAEFICWLMNAPSVLDMAASMVQGITRTRISMGRLRELHVPVPPIELQREFADRTEQIRSIQSQQSAATTKAQAAFDALLARCFSPNAVSAT